MPCLHSFVVTKSTTRWTDYQEVKIQEQVQKLAVGNIPRSMWVMLKDDLVDTCKAGDDVTICGTVMRRWRPLSVDVSRIDLRQSAELCNYQTLIEICVTKLKTFN